MRAPRIERWRWLARLLLIAALLLLHMVLASRQATPIAIHGVGYRLTLDGPSDSADEDNCKITGLSVAVSPF